MQIYVQSRVWKIRSQIQFSKDVADFMSNFSAQRVFETTGLIVLFEKPSERIRSVVYIRDILKFSANIVSFISFFIKNF